MSPLPPLSEDKPTSGEPAATAAFDPKATFSFDPIIIAAKLSE